MWRDYHSYLHSYDIEQEYVKYCEELSKRLKVCITDHVKEIVLFCSMLSNFFGLTTLFSLWQQWMECYVDICRKSIKVWPYKILGMTLLIICISCSMLITLLLSSGIAYLAEELIKQLKLLLLSLPRLLRLWLTLATM